MLKPTSVREVIDGYLMGKKYFTIEALKRILISYDFDIKPMTVKQQLYNLTRENNIYDAGRGWYSSIEAAWPLEKKPLLKIIKHIKTGFPEIPFSIWSASQLLPYADFENRSLPFFVYTDKNSIPVISTLLKSKGYETLPNPHTDEVTKFFSISDSSVIIRPSISEEPVDEEFATVEKILVDAYCEKDKTFLLDDAEYERLIREIILYRRINMGRLLRYASRRRVKDDLLEKFLRQEKDIIAV